MSIYNELDQIITEYVGYKEVGLDYDDETGQTFGQYDCADPVLYDNIIEELSRYIHRAFPFEYLSKDAQACFTEWESLLESQEMYARMRGED